MITSGLTKAIILPQTAITKCRDTVTLLADCCMAAGLMADAWVTSPEVDLLRFPTQIFGEKRDGKSVMEISLQEGLRRARVNQS
jgi:AMMECR1 domain-containing protein